jgi:hypothetical protein
MEAVMESGDLEIIRLELKYCERCGGLWLREQGNERVYCAACCSEIPDFPRFGRKIVRPRLFTNRALAIDGQDGGMWFSVSGNGGRA